MARTDSATISQDDVLQRFIDDLRTISRRHNVPLAELLEQFNRLVKEEDEADVDAPKSSSADPKSQPPVLVAMAEAPRPVARSIFSEVSLPLGARAVYRIEPISPPSAGLSEEARGSETIVAAVAGAAAANADPEPAPRSTLSEPPLSEAPLSEAAVTTDRYTILERLGEGGMGQVYRAFDHDLNRIVALKAIDRGLMKRQASALMRFIEEAQTTAQLQHPGIVPVHEIGLLEDGRLYFTMKVVRGRTLDVVAASVHEASTDATWGATSDGWTFRRLIDAFHRVCQAVAYAHGRGVLHRDLKPENIMIDAHGEVRIMDWGIAKIVRRQESISNVFAPNSTDDHPVFATRSRGSIFGTLTGAVTGTPYYMSPEQARGANQEVDERSDVYSLGAILYELLAGDRPYAGASPSDVLRVVQERPPRPLHSRDRPVPEELIRIQERAMAHKPADRYANADALAKDVASFLDGVAKHEKADKLLDSALAADARREVELAEAEALTREADEKLRGMPLWAPEEEKAPAWALLDRAAAIRRQAGLDSVEAEQQLLLARSYAPEHPKILAALARRHEAAHRRAEIARDAEGAARAESFLREYALALPKNHPERQEHLAYLEGNGLLSIESDPPADVSLYRLELQNRRLVPVFATYLGRSPLRAIALPHGSYVLELSAEGYEICRYPVQIERLGHWDGIAPGAERATPLRLLPSGSLGPDEIYVPGGPFWFGGDPEVTNTVSRRKLWLDSFIIQRTPVTNEQYLRFLNALVASGREEEALRCVPRERAADPRELGAMIYLRGEGGLFAMPDDSRAERFTSNKPVTCVTWLAVSAYTRWLAETTGKPWRLPTEFEWEKAARGVDERFFPWGNFFDPSWLCMRQSHRATPGPADVNDFPNDTSVYGVRGLAGNVRDWCLDLHHHEIPHAHQSRVPSPDLDALLADKEASRVVRGGSWSSFANNCRLAFRFFASPFFSGEDGGFRPVRSV